MAAFGDAALRRLLVESYPSSKSLVASFPLSDWTSRVASLFDSPSFNAAWESRQTWQDEESLRSLFSDYFRSLEVALLFPDAQLWIRTYLRGEAMSTCDKGKGRLKGFGKKAEVPQEEFTSSLNCEALQRCQALRTLRLGLMESFVDVRFSLHLIPPAAEMTVKRYASSFSLFVVLFGYAQVEKKSHRTGSVLLLPPTLPGDKNLTELKNGSAISGLCVLVVELPLEADVFPILGSGIGTVLRERTRNSWLRELGQEATNEMLELTSGLDGIARKCRMKEHIDQGTRKPSDATAKALHEEMLEKGLDLSAMQKELVQKTQKKVELRPLETGADSEKPAQRLASLIHCCENPRYRDESWERSLRALIARSECAFVRLQAGIWIEKADAACPRKVLIRRKLRKARFAQLVLEMPDAEATLFFEKAAQTQGLMCVRPYLSPPPEEADCFGRLGALLLLLQSGVLQLFLDLLPRESDLN